MGGASRSLLPAGVGDASRSLVLGAVLAVAVVIPAVLLSSCSAGLSRFLIVSLPSYGDAAVIAFYLAFFVVLISVLKKGLGGDKDSSELYEVLILTVVPFILVQASLYAAFLHKDALLQFDKLARFSLKFGWIHAVVCIAASVYSRSIKRLPVGRIFIFLIRIVSFGMFSKIAHGYYGVIVKHC